MGAISSAKWGLPALLLCMLLPTPASFAQEPVTAQSLMAGAWAKYRAGDVAGAKTIWQQLVADYPTSEQAPDAQLRLGYLQIKQGASSDQTIAEFEKVVEHYAKTPQAPEAQFRIGMLYQAGKQFDQAIEAFRKTLLYNPMRREILAQAKAQIGFSILMKYYAVEGSSTPAQNKRLRLAHEAQKELTEAVKWFQDHPAVGARARLGLGECALLLDDPVEARRQYQLVIGSSPDLPYCVGVARFGLGCASNKRLDFTQAIRDFGYFLNNLAGSSLADKDKSWKTTCVSGFAPALQALIYSGDAWERVPASTIAPEAAYWLAYARYVRHEFSQAASLARELTAGFPDHPLAAKAKVLLANCQQ